MRLYHASIRTWADLEQTKLTAWSYSWNIPFGYMITIRASIDENWKVRINIHRPIRF